MSRERDVKVAVAGCVAIPRYKTIEIGPDT